MTWNRWLLVLAIVVLAATGVTLSLDHGSTADSQGAMLAVSPGGTVGLSTLSSDLRGLYHAVAEHEHTVEAVGCYCGCEQMLGHDDLLECFVRPDGMWERHAVGCAVCQTEAGQVLDARADGVPVDQIVADIDATYGPITAPQETDA